MSGLLTGKRVLITKSPEEAGVAFDMIESAGGEFIPFPAINVTPVEDFAEFDSKIRDLDNFDYLIFTSANAVKVFAGRVKELDINLNYDNLNYDNLDYDNPDCNNPDCMNIEVICTGSKTAKACVLYGIPAIHPPEIFSAGGILDFLNDKNIKNIINIKNKNILIPCSKLSGNELKTGLEKLGGNVTQIPIYEVAETPADDLSRQIKLISERKPDVFAFTSPSNFRNFISIMNIDKPSDYFVNSIVAAIGPTTKASIIKSNVNVDLLPNTFTLEELVKSIIDNYKFKMRRKN